MSTRKYRKGKKSKLALGGNYFLLASNVGTLDKANQSL